jgi:Skp family chaperone for outer membrane proteins
MRLLFAGFLGVGLLMPVVEQAVQSRSTVSIGYISMQRVLSESLEAKAAAKRLEELRQARAKDIAAKQKALEATRLEQANAGGVFAASKRAGLKARGDQQQKEVQEATQQAQGEFVNVQRQLQTDLRGELNAIVADLAKRRAIQLVLNEDVAVVWTSTGNDLTAEVLERLNAAWSQKPKTK